MKTVQSGKPKLLQNLTIGNALKGVYSYNKYMILKLNFNLKERKLKFSHMETEIESETFCSYGLPMR